MGAGRGTGAGESLKKEEDEIYIKLYYVKLLT